MLDILGAGADWIRETFSTLTMRDFLFLFLLFAYLSPSFCLFGPAMWMSKTILC